MRQRLSQDFSSDLADLKLRLATLPTDWDGKKSILELKDADYNWRQMEWWAFYFEFLCFQRLDTVAQIPGDRCGTTVFDLKISLNWDLKGKAIKSDKNDAILNDVDAMVWSVDTFGEHGVIVALCDVEYNDVDRSFQQWHSELKGGKSKYEIERADRTSVSRYRKTSATLTELLYLRFDKSNLEDLGIMRQGRNSNGKPRPLKYMIDLEKIDPYLVDRQLF